MRPHFNYSAIVTLDVRHGSLADIAAALPDVRFTPESGRHRNRGTKGRWGAASNSNPFIERTKPQIVRWSRGFATFLTALNQALIRGNGLLTVGGIGRYPAGRLGLRFTEPAG
jgi:hypothetical protein